MRAFGLLLATALIVVPVGHAMAQPPGRGGGAGGSRGNMSDEDRQRMREAMAQRMQGGGGPGEMRGGTQGGGPGGMRGGMQGGGPGGMRGGTQQGGGPSSGGRGGSSGPSFGGRGGDSGRPSFGGRGGDSGRPSFGGRGGDPRGGGDTDRMTGFLQSLDANKDGVLNLREIPESRRGFASTMLERLGFDPSRSVSLKQLQEKMSQRAGRGSSEDEPLVPGFGVEEELPDVPTFGVRVEEQSAVSSNSNQSSGRRDRSGGSDRNNRENEANRGEQIAKMIFSRADRNEDGVLTKDEWGSLRGDPSELDKDKNGKITLAEVTNQMNNRMNGVEDEGEPTYRLSTATELLPDGLPDWFTEKDTNTDGQVSMAEYSSYYDDTTAQQFVALDLNNDGVVTPIEVIEVEGPQNNDRGRSFRRPGGDSGEGGFGGRPGGFGGGDSGRTFGGRTFGSSRGGVSAPSGFPGRPGGFSGDSGQSFRGGPGANLSDEDRQRMREMFQRMQQNSGGGRDRSGSGRRGG